MCRYGRQGPCDTLASTGVLGSRNCVAGCAFPSRPIDSSQLTRASSPEHHPSTQHPSTTYPSQIHSSPAPLQLHHLPVTMKTAVLLAAAGSASAAVYKTPLKKVSLSEQLVGHHRTRLGWAHHLTATSNMPTSRRRWLASSRSTRSRA
jgi:hypothetical protein